MESSDTNVAKKCLQINSNGFERFILFCNAMQCNARSPTKPLVETLSFFAIDCGQYDTIQYTIYNIQYNKNRTYDLNGADHDGVYSFACRGTALAYNRRRQKNTIVSALDDEGMRSWTALIPQMACTHTHTCTRFYLRWQVE